MNIIDISNWTIDEINNSIETFKDTSLTDIGMVNCDIDSINVVGEVTTATLWIDEDIGIDGYTGTAPLKIYKEDKVEIKLNSPLLKGDTIEVVDGKLCHVHRCDIEVLNGNENWNEAKKSENYNSYILGDSRFRRDNFLICPTLITQPYSWYTHNVDEQYISMGESSSAVLIGRLVISNSTYTVDELKQWLSENPITIIYQLLEPTYENITPLQSSITLKTFLESSMIINTNLPIKTNVSYRTNVPSISTLSNRVAEVSESDNVIHNLINIIDDEVDE